MRSRRDYNQKLISVQHGLKRKLLHLNVLFFLQRYATFTNTPLLK